MDVIIWTDGGCHGNPGPGGWAYIVTDSAGQTILVEERGSEACTTNNRMELTAVIKALEDQSALVAEAGTVEVRTDSQYVQKGITVWIRAWKNKGWRTSDKKPVKNVDLWQKLDALAARRPLKWQWVKGHAGNPLNERCDALVQQAIAEPR